MIDVARVGRVLEGLSHEQGVAYVACLGQRRPQNWVEKRPTQDVVRRLTRRNGLPLHLRRCGRASREIHKWTGGRGCG
jgi:hypothetical protein